MKKRATKSILYNLKLMAQLEESNTQTYLKEYPCYEFKFATKLVSKELSLTFRHTSNADPDILPNALIDRLTKAENLFLLLWEQRKGEWLLAVKKLASETWTNITMNLLP